MYISKAYKGYTDSWRYLLGIIIVVVCWQLIGGLPLLVSIAATLATNQNAVMPSTQGEMATLLGNNVFLLMMLFTFVFGLAALFLVQKFLHANTIKNLTTSRTKIDWKRSFFVFTIWSVVSIALLCTDILWTPENYQLNFNLLPFLGLVAISFLVLPLQTSFEEYFMRGYLMQSIGIAVKNKWVPLLATSLLFGLLHGINPEVEKLGYGIMVFYIGTGLFLGIITLMDEGLELALGFHAANNIVAALLVTADWTVFQTDSIYLDISEPILGWEVFFPVLVLYPLLLVVLAKKYGWTNWKERLIGKIPVNAANDGQ